MGFDGSAYREDTRGGRFMTGRFWIASLTRTWAGVRARWRFNGTYLVKPEQIISISGYRERKRYGQDLYRFDLSAKVRRVTLILQPGLALQTTRLQKKSVCCWLNK